MCLWLRQARASRKSLHETVRAWIKLGRRLLQIHLVQNNIYYGMMMLQAGDVDGLVGGALPRLGGQDVARHLARDRVDAFGEARAEGGAIFE